jgi:exopolyphosphatase / guanosine-5'-triphosphate,3'-diphosphate pyrophosphatase
VNGTRVAAVDAGTNTTRLLVAEVREGALTRVERNLAFTRLGQGIDATGRLGPRAIEATVAAIAAFAGRARELGAGRIRVAGTSAVREAANGEELLAAVKEATGLDLEVLPGEAEAALSFAGATQDLPAGRYLVCDIGGGSTELAEGRKAPALDERAGAGAGVEGAVSLRLGVVRLTERHLAHDPPAPEELAAMEEDIDRVLEAAGHALPDAASAAFVGVAGTVTSLAAIHLGLDHYDPELVHGSALARDDVAGSYRRLAAMSLPEREALPALPPGRSDVIVAGCAILTRAMARWSFPAVRVSDRDILDGLALELAELA